ncbi:hypothetical protein DI005_06550 [Prauserella sp. PE36]|nr:hypothetical protein DI005_06550 [Prauserella sp. PE36]
MPDWGDLSDADRQVVRKFFRDADTLGSISLAWHQAHLDECSPLAGLAPWAVFDAYDASLNS